MLLKLFILACIRGKIIYVSFWLTPAASCKIVNQRGREAETWSQWLKWEWIYRNEITLVDSSSKGLHVCLHSAQPTGCKFFLELLLRHCKCHPELNQAWQKDFVVTLACIPTPNKWNKSNVIALHATMKSREWKVYWILDLISILYWPVHLRAAAGGWVADGGWDVATSQGPLSQFQWKLRLGEYLTVKVHSNVVPPLL